MREIPIRFRRFVSFRRKKKNERYVDTIKILCRITNDRVGINADLLSRKILDNGTEDKSSSGNRKLINSRGKIGKRLTVG